MLNLKNKDVIVLGLGKSGVASCHFLASLEANVIAFDEKDKNSLKENVKKLPKGVIVKYGKITTLPKADLIVVSPGIPSDISYIKKAKEQGILVISEIELAFQMIENQPIIAITGTNGKTTTTTLIGKILESGGLKPVVCGNIEIPFTSCITNIKKDNIIVLEISSFQLETIVEFKPNISIFLNFAPDHLDRYLKIEDYMKAKARIFENQTKDDIMIINADDYVVLNLSRRSRAKPYLFSTKQTLQEGLFIRSDWIVARFFKEEERILPLSEIKLIGCHNLENILASILVAIILRLDISS
ncbi:MAG: UDP-N-acetylmuramoyl-L-alanine--D-glutamate ligase, partial [bacterium]